MMHNSKSSCFPSLFSFKCFILYLALKEIYQANLSNSLELKHEIQDQNMTKMYRNILPIRSVLEIYLSILEEPPSSNVIAV